MTSYVERLLPSLQKREWTIQKQRDVGSNHKFEALLKFLLQEKSAVEYMNKDIRDSTLKKRYAAVNLTECNKPDACDNVGTGSISTLQRAVKELTKTTAASNYTGNSSSRRNNESRCWIHNTETHDTSECNTFKTYPKEKKIESVKQNGACYHCLKIGHLSRYVIWKMQLERRNK